MAERAAPPGWYFEVPAVVPLTVRLAAGPDVLHVLAALPHPDGTHLAVRLGRDDPDPLWSIAPVAAALRAVLEVVLDGDELRAAAGNQLAPWGAGA